MSASLKQAGALILASQIIKESFYAFKEPFCLWLVGFDTRAI
jgi:hypothetical protein